MQQASSGSADGLLIRVGLNVGEAFRDYDDYFGTQVIVARGSCDGAEAGHILCSSLVAGLLSGRRAFTFQTMGEQTLKGVAQPVAVSKLLYEADEPSALLARHRPS